MAQNELFNILNPDEAPYMSLPPVTRGPLELANVPRFQQEPRPYSINTNAISLLSQVLGDIVTENTIGGYLDDFSAKAEFPGPGDSRMSLGYNVPSRHGYNIDWELGMQVPFEL